MTGARQWAVDKNGVEFKVGALIRCEPLDDPPTRAQIRRVLFFENGWPAVRVGYLDERWDPQIVEVVRP
jgi:hypothetical protein